MNGLPPRRSAPLRIAVLGTLLAVGFPGFAMAGGKGFDQLYPSLPYSTNPMGYFATGMALADINGDHLPDMVVSNGNDMAPQSLTVFYNHRLNSSRFNLWPDWYSGDIDYQFDLATGDVNGDGRLDVAVAVGFNHARERLSGGVKVYLNQGDALATTPAYRSEGGFLAMACAFGDANGDGALDLAVTDAGNMTIPPKTPPALWKPGRARIYLNQRDGTLSPTPAWTSAESTYGGDTLFADINQDGYLDLVVAGGRLQVFYGHAPKKGEAVPIDTRPAWSWPEKDPLLFSYSVDQGSLWPGAPVSLVMTRIDMLKNQTHEVLVFEPPKKEPVWSYTQAAYPSKLLLADLDNDHKLDLALGQWGEQAQGGALVLFQGTGSIPPFPPSPTVTVDSNTPSVLEGLDVADTRQRCVQEKSYALTAAQPHPVVTLPERRIAALRKVTRNGGVLKPDQYAWVPNSNWLSLPLETGDQIKVDYEVSPIMDIGAANYHNYSPQIGNYMFFSALTPPDCLKRPGDVPAQEKTRAHLPHR